MQVNIEQLEKLARKAHFELPMDPINKNVDDRLKQIAKNAKVQGFRPGKAPVKVIEQQQGDDVRREVISRTIQNAFVKMVEENKLDIVGEPAFEPQPIEDENATTLVFDVLFDVKPEIVLTGLEACEVKRPTLTVTDAEVDQTIEMLRKRHPKYAAVERVSQTEDRLIVDYVGRIDGSAFQGGAAAGEFIFLGEGRFLPAFEKALVGHKTDETVTFDLTFPENYGAQEVAGKTAQFEVTIKEVAGPVLPDVDEEFVKGMGIPDGKLEKLRADIKGNLEIQVARQLRERTKRAVINKVSTAVAFDLPESMVTAEQQQLLQSAYQELMKRGVTEEQAPLPEDKFRSAAEERIRARLIFDRIIVDQNFATRPELVKAKVEAFSKAYQQPDEVVKTIYADASQLSNFRTAVLEDQVVDWLLGQMTVVDEATPFSEIMPGMQ